MGVPRRAMKHAWMLIQLGGASLTIILSLQMYSSSKPEVSNLDKSMFLQALQTQQHKPRTESDYTLPTQAKHEKHPVVKTSGELLDPRLQLQWLQSAGPTNLKRGPRTTAPGTGRPNLPRAPGGWADASIQYIICIWYVYIYIYIHIHIYIYIYVYTYISLSLYIYIYIYM